MGQFIYGGSIVYDTDAKRLWLGVNTPGVYSRQTARQMAEGGLRNSRAMVAIAVTGNAMVLPDHLDDEGIVDIGISIRGSVGFKTVTRRFAFCQDKEFTKLCELWKSYQQPNVDGKAEYATMHITQVIAKAIRLVTTVKAIEMATAHIEKFSSEIGARGRVIERQTYDGNFLGCNEPSDIISEHMKDDGTVLSRQWHGVCPQGHNTSDTEEH